MYEKEVMDRIEQIRVNQGYSMEYFAEYIGVELETYKRSKYKKIRVDLYFLHAVGTKFPANMDYILFGKSGQNYKLINTYVSGSDEERAQVFDELARYCRDKEEAKKKNEDRLRRKAIESYDVDYETEEGLIERPKRKTSTKTRKTFSGSSAKRTTKSNTKK